MCFISLCEVFNGISVCLAYKMKKGELNHVIQKNSNELSAVR